MPLKSPLGVSESELNGFTTILEASFISTGSFRVIAQNERDTILEEQAFSLSGCSDQACAIEIGELISADYLITGSLNKTGSRYIVSINLMSVQSGEIEKNAIVTLYTLLSVEELKTKCRELAETIAGIETESGYAGRQVESYTGSLTFNVIPTDATLIFNLTTEYTDYPAKVENFPVGDYPVRITAPGYQPYITAVKVEKGETGTIDIVLEPAGEELIVPEKGKGFLNIYTSPPGMGVMIDYDLLPEKTPLVNYELESGEYKISVGDYHSEYEFYEAEDEINIYIEEGSSEELNLELPPKKGRLRLSSNVPDAEVYINGRGYGFLTEGNIMLTDLQCGPSEVSLYHAKYETGTESFLIRPGMNNIIEMELLPHPVALIIDSNPQGAEIFLNGRSSGKTPAVLDDISQDTYTYSLGYNGYRTRETEIRVSGTEDYTIIEDLTNTLTFLIPDQREQGAYIYLDGKENPSGVVGEDGLTLSYISVGTHHLRVEKEGYATEERVIEVPVRNEGRVDDIVFNLVLDDIPYAVQTQPRGAVIYLDGEDTGLTTPATIKLSEGEHEIALAKIGFLRMKETVTVDSTEGGMIRLNLPEGNDPGVMREYYEHALEDLNPGSQIDLLTAGLSNIEGFRADLTSLDIDTRELENYLTEKQAEIYGWTIEQRLKLIEEPVKGDVFGLPQSEFNSLFPEAFNNIDALLSEIRGRDSGSSNLEEKVEEVKTRLSEKRNNRLAAAGELGQKLQALRAEIDEVQSRKRSLDTWGIVIGVASGAALGGTGYCVWQTADNYANYNDTPFTDLAREYKDAANTYTLASSVGLGTTLLSGIAEIFILNSRKKVMGKLVELKTQAAELAAEAANRGMAGAFGGLE
ncbi:MAG: PEGA domain-containing protein [Spirochaetales bacterium]|nr:PEGA domain-containing protein [Spirochaetales bacterium]